MNSLLSNIQKYVFIQKDKKTKINNIKKQNKNKNINHQFNRLK